jgi:hypothetical protein
MQNADNIDTAAGAPVKEEIVTDGKAVYAGRKVLSGKAHARGKGQEGEPFDDRVNQPVGSLDATRSAT